MKLFGIRSRRRASGLTVIDERLTIRGDIDTEGTVRVDGRVEGISHRIGTLIVGPRGSVLGDVVATDVVVAGRICGNVEAQGRVEIEPGATVTGDVHATALVVREGSSISGQFRVHETLAQVASPEDEDEPAAQFPVHGVAA